MHTKQLQNLQWKLQVALSGSEVLKVEVYMTMNLLVLTGT